MKKIKNSTNASKPNINDAMKQINEGFEIMGNLLVKPTGNRVESQFGSAKVECNLDFYKTNIFCRTKTENPDATLYWEENASLDETEWTHDEASEEEDTSSDEGTIPDTSSDEEDYANSTISGLPLRTSTEIPQ